MAQRASTPAVLSPTPRLPSAPYRTYSPSPTRSAQRNTDLEHDPLLANLSPRDTLNALAQAEALSPTQRKSENALSKSVAEASASERALGVRAAHAGKQLREWCEELQKWKWPSYGFALPRTEAERQKMLGWAKRYEETRALHHTRKHDDDEEYWGSFPSWVVQDLEERIEAIRDDMETLEVEELKDHVRLAHGSSRPNSRLDYQNLQGVQLSHAHLDDFTALITATIMNALPYIFRLESLLNVWSTRLALLRQIPSWSRGLDDTESSLELGWQSIGRRKGAEPWTTSDITREAYKIMKSVLEDKVVGIGQRTDAMLDLIEGGNDVLPEEWIDRMDAVEEDYRRWVIEAERVANKNEWEAETLANQTKQHTNNVQRPPESEDETEELIEDETAHSVHVEPTRVLSLDGQDQSPDGNNDSHPEDDYVNVHRPQKLDLQRDDFAESRTPSDVSPPDSASSGDFFSYMSSPELSTASRVEYFKSSLSLPLPADSMADLDTVSRHSSQRTAKGVELASSSSATTSPSPRPRALSFTPRSTIDEIDVSVDPPTSESEYEPPSPELESAFRHSLEIVRPGVVRNVSVRRSSSNSLSKSALAASGMYYGATQSLSVPRAVPSHFTSKYSSPHPVSGDSRELLDLDGEMGQEARGAMKEPHISERLTSTSGPTAASPKDHIHMTDTEVPSTSSHCGQSTTSSPVKTPKATTSRSFGPKSPPISPKSTDEQIEERISSILTNLPAKIQLKSRRENSRTDSHPSTPFQGHRKSGSMDTPTDRLSRTQSSTPSPSTPGLTLSAAKKPRHQPDSEIKLYHLHQPGRDAPIKLYIRLVGEGGERVMVRVGGGWADLGEYLKEYATHHGKRSDGKFDVTNDVTFQSLSSVPTLSAFGSSNPSTPASSRPGTPISAPKPSFFHPRKTRLSAADAAPPSTPENHHHPAPHFLSRASTPGSADSSLLPGSSSRRSSSSRTSWGGGGLDETPLGLAGPKAKGADISPGRQAWVDGMMDQARKASAEKNKGGEFGDLGKVGGTKRLFLRGRGGEGS